MVVRGGSMNVNVLIDNIVRQTTVLIAQLATSAGLRAPLAHIADEIFLTLVHELEAQGVNRKVAADMFGLALRSYQYKVRRITESATEKERTLWEAVLDFIRDNEPVTSADVSRRFCRDDERVLRGVLHDQIESGLVFTSGRGPSAVYRIASDEDIRRAIGPKRKDAVDAIVWIGVYRYGPSSPEKLAETLGLEKREVELALERLVADGRVERVDEDGEPVHRSQKCVLPMGSTTGWEAALFDHYQALVRTLAIKLDQLETQTLPADAVGGSTYSFDIWPGHPFERRVLGLLGEQRRQLSKLREEVTEFDEKNGCPSDEVTKVTFYFGQSLQKVPVAKDGDATN